MTLKVRVEEGRSLTKTVVLEGRLDNESVGAFDEALDAVLLSAATVVVFDLSGLEYVTSAGLRSIFRAQKAMNARAGRFVLLNPTPQVKKVLDIVKLPELGVVFRNVQELDAYLDAMQKKVAEGG
jgi:anti-anti-sigma factor